MFHFAILPCKLGRVHPILIQLGPLTLRTYGLLIAIGFLAACWLFRKRANRLGMDDAAATNLMILLLLSGIAGARVYYVAWHWNDIFARDPIAILKIYEGGIVFYGGFLASCAVLYGWSRWKGIPFISLADAAVPSLVLAHAFGRLGCFMGGCCYGSPCDHFWAVRLHAPPEIAGMAIHPTQLYEVAGLLNILATLLVIERISRYPGQVFFSYCILYSLMRFIVEFFRGDVPHNMWGHLTLAQVVCIALFIFAWLASARLSYLAGKARAKRIREEIRKMSASNNPKAD